MKVVIVGAGRIGCGFAGQLCRAAGHEVLFVARDPLVVDQLNRVGRYCVRLVKGPETENITVEGVRAVSVADFDRVVAEMAGAGLIATAVGAGNLPLVAPLIAAALRWRKATANILAFENLKDAGCYLRLRVAGLLPLGFPLARHGFSGALVSRAVTHRLGDPGSDEPLTFVGDPPGTFVVDGRSLRPPLPAIKGMIVADDFNAWVQRKLYTYSAGHAITAYLGYLKGYHYIHTAIRDPEIRADVLAAMTEGQRGLLARYGPEIAGDENDLLEIIARFENAALNDPIVRVGRDPKRKLGAEDRLVGAARLAVQAGINPEKLALGAAAALLFNCPDDPSAADLQRAIETVGPGPALRQVSGLDPSQGLGHFVADIRNRLANGWRKGNLLLSLDRLMWAWS